MKPQPSTAVALVWLRRYVACRDVAYWRGMVDTFRPSERPVEPSDAEFAAAMGWDR